MENAQEYSAYSHAMGFDAVAVDAVHVIRDLLGRKADRVSENWLQYMAWSARDEGRLMVLAWERYAVLYELLTLVQSLQPPLILRGPDFLLNGKLAKFEGFSKNLLIDPPRYDSIVRWLGKLPDARTALDLANYLMLGSQPTSIPKPKVVVDTCGGLLASHKVLTHLLKEPSKNPALAHAVCVLLATMQRWNESFFKGYKQ